MTWDPLREDDDENKDLRTQKVLTFSSLFNTNVLLLL